MLHEISVVLKTKIPLAMDNEHWSRNKYRWYVKASPDVSHFEVDNAFINGQRMFHLEIISGEI